MSPTPAATEDGNDAQRQLNFNQNHQQLPQSEGQTSGVAVNGHAPEVKSAYFHTGDEPEKTRRGRPPKSGSKPALPNGTVKKRGRPPKVKTEDVPPKQSKLTDTMKKTKRTVNRFKDVSKEELLERFLPDRIKPDLDILIIGINPGLFAAYKGHHYAGPGNHFWSCLNMSGFVDRKMTAENDADLLNYGIGFSTIVQRTTPAAKDLSSKEIREGAKKLIEKIQTYKPKIAAFNGKGIYEIFSKEIFGQKKKDFSFGTQTNKIPGTETRIYVMPSSSARCAQFPRAQDKVHFYVKLKQLRDEIKGLKTDAPVCEVGYAFDLKKATELAKIQNIKQEKFDPEYEANDTSKNGATYPVFSTTDGATASGGQGVTHNATDLNNNNNAILGSDRIELTNGEIAAIDEADSKQPANVKILPKKNDTVDNNVTARHAHLVRYLRQVVDHQEPGTSNGRKGPAGSAPATLSPGNPKLQEDVSEEQKQERVGNWVREQQNLEYDSEPPMGMERREESAPGGHEGALPAGVEIDGASQLSAISAGVSGSASESTSGYGSIDASSRRVRLDRVEMWVLEQQHVRRHNVGNQHHLQQSIQAASNGNQNQLPVTTARGDSHLQNNPVTTWQPVMTNATLNGYVGGAVSTAQSFQGQVFSNSNRNLQKVSSAHANHPPLPSDQLPGPSGLNLSAGRSSPYGFVRTPRREGGSGSSYGTSVRPPVPLYSSWGGEGSNSGGSAISSPVVLFVPNHATQPSPTQPFIATAANTISAQSGQSSQVYSNSVPMSWQPTNGSNNLLTPHFNL